VKTQFTSLFSKSPAENGFNQPAGHLLTRHWCAPGRARGDVAGAPVPKTLGAHTGAPRQVVEMIPNRRR
jgi:aconitate hydratase